MTNTAGSWRACAGALLLPALFATGCGPGENLPLECGEGTEERNGTCVAIADVTDSCGDGTVFDETTGKCEPAIVCGEGTVEDTETGECVPMQECGPGTEPDLSTGECVPVASCGEGTTLDEESGECLPDASCGAGTELVDGECVAVGVCASGSVLNMDTGLCESHTECGPNQVLSGGQCVNANVAVGLDADVTESTPDQNDPLWGGTPEPLTLEPVGEETVFVGNIARPTDLGGNGVLTQDRDVWSFTGSAGQYLRLSVLGTGLPQPAFIVEGPRGYRRMSPLLSTNDTSREVVLPYDGEYRVVVVPTAWISTELPLGSTTSGYVGVIEALDRPTPTTVVPAADQTAPVEVTGNLRDLSDNFLLLDADVGDAVSLIFADSDPQTPPAVLAFNGAGELITHIELNLEEGAWVGTLVQDEPGTTVVVDWQFSTAANDAYTLRVAEAPRLDVGVASDGTSGQSPPTLVHGETVVAYTVTLPSPLLLFWDLDNMSAPDIQMHASGGTYGQLLDMTSGFFYGDPDTYTFFVFNDDTEEDPEAALVYETLAPLDLGVLDPTAGGSSSRAGHFLTDDFMGPGDVWAIARTTEDALLGFDVSVATGDPEISVFDRAGQLLRVYDDARELPLHLETMAGDPIIVRLEASSDAVLEWELTATAEPFPLIIDLEPNDVSSTAVELTALPTIGYGTLDSEQVDRYKITFPEPLAPNQTVQISVENIENSSPSFTSNSFIIRVYDELDQPVASAERYFGHNNFAVYLGAHETQSSSTFYIELSEYFLEREEPYVLRVEIVDGAVEVEPNDDLASADVATSLPAIFYAQITEDEAGDEVDLFRFTAPALQPNEALSIRFDNISSSRSQDIAVLDAAGNVLIDKTAINPRFLTAQLPPGDYYVRVGEDTILLPYRMTIEVVTDVPVEVEPNDDLAMAGALGVLPTGGVLWSVGGTIPADPDWYTFSLPEPLAAGEGLVVRGVNVATSELLTVRLYDVSVPETPSLLGRFKGSPAFVLGEALGTGPFAVEVITDDSDLQLYYLRIERGDAPDEVEPNDDLATARYLGELADGGLATGTGTTANNDADWFTFTVGQSVAADAGLWVSFVNIADSTDLRVTLYDASDPSNLVQLAIDDDDPGRLVSGQTGATLYALKLVGTSSSNDLHQLRIDVGPPAEVSPNGDAASATPIELPTTIYGTINNTKKDFFSFTLPAALAPTAVVQIVFDNLDSTTTFDVHLRNAGGTSLVTDDDDILTIHSAAGLAAGTYTVSVEGTDSSLNPETGYVYQLDVRIVDTAVTP